MQNYNWLSLLIASSQPIWEPILEYLIEEIANLFVPINPPLPLPYARPREAFHMDPIPNWSTNGIFQNKQNGGGRTSTFKDPLERNEGAEAFFTWLAETHIFLLVKPIAFS